MSDKINTYNSFYVAITRGKEDARVFTDSADNLREQVKSLQVKQTELDYAGGSKEQASSQERGSKQAINGILTVVATT